MMKNKGIIYIILNRSGIYRAAIALCLTVIAFSLTACEKEKTPHKSNASESPGIHKTFERGPVSVDLDIDKKEITIADRVNLSITVISDEDYEVRLPAFGSKLEQFGIIDYHTTQPELVDDNRQKISRSYVLEPFLSGDYVIPPMQIDFWKKGEKEKDLHTLETEEITIKVSSLLPEKMEDIKLHEIRPPVALPRSKDMWIWAAAAAGLMAVGIVLLVIIRYRKKKVQQEVSQKIPPHELAFTELQRLVDEDLIQKGEIKLFYQRISDVLRHYIENRFGLRAPEQTTEEFLMDLEASNTLPVEYRPLLKTFLTHCDLVKFAEHRPTTEDIQRTFDSCKNFITGTQEKDIV